MAPAIAGVRPSSSASSIARYRRLRSDQAQQFVRIGCAQQLASVPTPGRPARPQAGDLVRLSPVPAEVIKCLGWRVLGEQRRVHTWHATVAAVAWPGSGNRIQPSCTARGPVHGALVLHPGRAANPLWRLTSLDRPEVSPKS
jgi:hypothetical protein